jgi:hypothetical protein
MEHKPFHKQLEDEKDFLEFLTLRTIKNPNTINYVLLWEQVIKVKEATDRIIAIKDSLVTEWD